MCEYLVKRNKPWLSISENDIFLLFFHLTVMSVKYSITNPILLVSCIFGWRREKCPLNSVCTFRRFEGKLFADCSDRSLSRAPIFSDDVIAINFAKHKYSTIPQNLPTKLLYLEMSKMNKSPEIFLRFKDTLCCKISVCLTISKLRCI